MHNVVVAIVLTAHYQRWRTKRHFRDTRNRRLEYMLNTQSPMIRRLVSQVR